MIPYSLLIRVRYKSALWLLALAALFALPPIKAQVLNDYYHQLQIIFSGRFAKSQKQTPSVTIKSLTAFALMV